MTRPSVTPPFPADFRQASLDGVFWSGAQQLGERSTRWIFYLILARLVAPEAVGVVVLAGTIVEVIQVVLSLGLTGAVMQREQLESGHLDSAFWGHVALSIPATLACMAAAPALGAALGIPSLAPVLRVLALAIPLAALDGVQEALFRRRFAFRALALRGVVGQIAGGVIALALAAAGTGAWSLVAFALVPFAVGTGVLWLLSSWRPGFEISIVRYRELLEFGAFATVINVVGVVQRRADHLLIGAALGPVALGYYAMARQFIIAVTDPLERATGPVVWATLCRLQGDPERLDRAVRGFAGYQALILLPASLGIAASAPVLVPLMLGETWQPSVPVLQALGCLAAVVTLAGASSAAVLAVGAARWRAMLEFLRAGVSLGALLLGMRWGIAGVGWALVASAVLFLPVQLSAARLLVPLRIAPYLGRLAVPVFAGAVMAATVVGLRTGLEGRLPAAGLLVVMMASGAAVYAAAVWLLSPRLAREALESARSALPFAGQRGAVK
jgi:PST family polysaccharide transporter